MDWSDLPIFLAVARNGQLAKAAQALEIDATTAGRRLRRLEKSLGERLFEQGPDGQTLTPAGERLLTHAREMERAAAAMRHPEQGGPVRGTVRVSVSEGFGTWFVSRHLGTLADAHPGLSVDLVASSGFLSPSRRETDIAVLLARPRRGPLITRKLADYGLRLYASRDYLANSPPLDTAGDLRQHRLIGYVPDILYAPELRYLDEIPGAHEPQLRSSSINAQFRMATYGAGVAVLPCFIGDSSSALARVLPDIVLRRSFWLVTHEETRHFAQVEAFVEWLTALAARHRGELEG
ncbi:LysR family transcriptional regulator [Sphingomonas turrisvirgatae]|uniref:LysR family transcriptional regulator n=1 Tax=Sphingomonas turrisvirgatae TaxID=1888892 RepID=A0A1E3LY33_9SPHN|nr:LysR family transcriptional regulator [Sphingomonas turrisvirgatae]ODP38623.1 LysR family transcriptional regulator [Sphingomonas turrisvirgatae]